ncbi:MAG TPA: hypothetical protein VGL28_12815 [Steroidobacteraceae bacterium]|jgi:hypothetical protein
MITRVAIPLLLLPLLALLLPVMFALAWIREAIGDRSLNRPVRRRNAHDRLVAIRAASQRAGSLHHHRL